VKRRVLRRADGQIHASDLTEISFVSSPTDEDNLQSEIYRQQIAEALFKGIEQYTTSHERYLASAAPKKANR
jgi:N-acetylmuramoyl-L-alanine amidase